MKFLLEGMNKKQLLLICGLIVLIVLFSLYLLIRPKESKIIKTQPQALMVTSSPTEQSSLAVTVFQEDELSPEDKEAKYELLMDILHGIESGVVFESDNVRIEYVQTANAFQAEILAGNIIDAREETNIFFRRRGISPQGVCNLPLSFYYRRSFEQTTTDETLPISC